MDIKNALPKWAISIHALHEESDNLLRFVRNDRAIISIHALHEESDPKCSNVFRPDPISIHALHEESDSCDEIWSAIDHPYFNPRSP